MARRRTVVKLGIPALIVAVLAVAALWRVGGPVNRSTVVGTSSAGSVVPALTPLTGVADLLTTNAIGREASLEEVYVRDRVGDRSFWIGSGNEPAVFAVLDPDVKNTDAVEVLPGRRVTLIGLVRPVPTAVEAVDRWHVPTAAGTLIEESRTYLHVTEVRR